MSSIEFVKNKSSSLGFFTVIIIEYESLYLQTISCTFLVVGVV